MGHRHTSEEFAGAGGIFSTNRRFAAPAPRRDEASSVKPPARAESIALSATRHQIKEQMESSAVPVNAPPPSLPVRVALFVLRFYKAYLSMLMAGSCRYEPTCSLYASAAIERFGVIRGSWLACKRLLRCQPFSGRFGLDPVPEEWPGGISGKNTEAHS